MNERELTRKVLAWLNQQPDVWALKHHGGPYSTVGVPDIIACVNGWFFAVELKGEHGTVTMAQSSQLRRIAAAHGWGIVADSLETVQFHVQALRERTGNDGIQTDSDH